MSDPRDEYKKLTKAEIKKYSGWPNVKFESEAKAAPVEDEPPKRGPGRPRKVEADTPEADS